MPQRYRHRIEIQQRQESRGATGEVLLTWANAFPAFVGGIPAEVLTGPGREFRAANSEIGEITARINFRGVIGVTQQMRVLWRGVAYNIGSVEQDATGVRETRLLCTGGVTDGR